MRRAALLLKLKGVESKKSQNYRPTLVNIYKNSNDHTGIALNTIDRLLSIFYSIRLLVEPVYAFLINFIDLTVSKTANVSQHINFSLHSTHFIKFFLLNIPSFHMETIEYYLEQFALCFSVWLSIRVDKVLLVTRNLTNTNYVLRFDQCIFVWWFTLQKWFQFSDDEGISLIFCFIL